MEKSNVILSLFADKIPFKLKDIPNLLVTTNFEQVYGMVRNGEVHRLCILIGAYNYSKNRYNVCSGQVAAEDIAKIDPSLPILIWQGKSMEKEPLSRDNHTYLEGTAATLFDFMHQCLSG